MVAFYWLTTVLYGRFIYGKLKCKVCFFGFPQCRCGRGGSKLKKFEDLILGSCVTGAYMGL